MDHLKGLFVFSAFFFFQMICLSTEPLYAQESILSSYERNFIRADLAGKTAILSDAATDENAPQFMGDLYEFALQFALVNGDYLKDDPDMISLVSTAARGAGTSGNLYSVKSLWDLFQVYTDPYSRVDILGALATLGMGNQAVIGNLNLFLRNEINSYKSSGSVNQGTGDTASASAPEIPVLGACISALGKLGDSSSFSVLFSAMTAGYPDEIKRQALTAMDSIRGNYKDFLTDVIKKNPYPEKVAAFRLGAYNEKLSTAERGELAETALEISLEQVSGQEVSRVPDFGSDPFYAATLRYEAVIALTLLKWTPAAPLAIRNFYIVLSDYTNGAVPKERLIEAITCMGVMGNSDAAQALALQLGYINSITEKSGEYDEAVVMALINALGVLADKSAFDNLLYIGYLNYSNPLQTAAREALNRLKW